MTSIKDCQENIANFLISNIIILLRLTTKKEMSFKTLPLFHHSRTWVQSRDISEASIKMLSWHEYHLYPLHHICRYKLFQKIKPKPVSDHGF